MPTLHVRNVPEELYESIRRKARLGRRSLSQEVITLLQRAVQQPERSQAEVLESIRRNRHTPPSGAPDAVTLLREDRER
jgi:plasmid stability protein